MERPDPGELGAWQEMVDDLLGLDQGLSGWEIDFIESIAGRLEEREGLTPAQADKLREIWRDRG